MSLPINNSSIRTNSSSSSSSSSDKTILDIKHHLHERRALGLQKSHTSNRGATT